MPDLQQCSLSLDDAFGIYMLHCKSRRFRKSTIDFYHCRLPRFFNWLAQHEITKLHQVNNNHIRAYLAELQGDEDDNPDEALSGHFQEAATGKREKAIVFFVLDTGMRVIELVALNGGDTDLKTGTVRIREGKGENCLRWL